MGRLTLPFKKEKKEHNTPIHLFSSTSVHTILPNKRRMQEFFLSFSNVTATDYRKELTKAIATLYSQYLPNVSNFYGHRIIIGGWVHRC